MKAQYNSRSPAAPQLPVTFRVIRPDELEWTTREHEPDEAARHVAELSESAGFAHTRANVWRYDPGAKGRRHKHVLQEETFVVLAGTLTMYLGDPPERHDVPTGGLLHVELGTPLQTVNHGDEISSSTSTARRPRMSAPRSSTPRCSPLELARRPAGPIRFPRLLGEGKP